MLLIVNKHKIIICRHCIKVNHKKNKKFINIRKKKQNKFNHKFRYHIKIIYKVWYMNINKWNLMKLSQLTILSNNKDICHNLLDPRKKELFTIKHPKLNPKYHTKHLLNKSNRNKHKDNKFLINKPNQFIISLIQI